MVRERFKTHEGLTQYTSLEHLHKGPIKKTPHMSSVPPVPYHVVMTDYNRYACVYSCYELFSLMFEAFSILSRSAEIDDASLAACHLAFTAMELDLTRLVPVQQAGDCLEVQLEGSGECKEVGMGE